MSTLEVLTLIIAFAGVLAAAGAVWTGFETRRYAKDAREALAEQARRWRQELQISTFLQIEERWDAADMRSRRAALAKRWNPWLHPSEGTSSRVTPTEFALKVGSIDAGVFEFFETLGLLLRLEYLDRELVWNAFAVDAVNWWRLSGRYIAKDRTTTGDPTLFEEFERLATSLQDEDAKRRNKPVAEIGPTDEALEEFLKSELKHG